MLLLTYTIAIAASLRSALAVEIEFDDTQYDNTLRYLKGGGGCPQVKNHGCYEKHDSSPKVDDINVLLGAGDEEFPLCGRTAPDGGSSTGYDARFLFYESAAVAT